MRRKFFLLLILVALGIISCKTDDSDSENVLQKFLLIFDSENVLQKFSVTFDSDGGSKVKGQVIESGKTATKPENPTKDGYDFEVWVLGDSPFDFSTPIISDITLKAKWTKHSSTTLPEEQKQFFTVTFDTNGGSEVTSQIVEINKTATKPEDPKKTGYTFIDWYKDDTPFDFTKTITSGITITAKWKPNKYTIIFDKTNGSGQDMQELTLFYDEEKSLPDNTYEAPIGMIFAGWATDNVSSSLSYLDKQKVKNLTSENNSIITLYAVWIEKDAHSIRYWNINFTGETIDNSENPTIYLESQNVQLKNVERTGYSFGGWFTDSNYSDNSKITGWSAGEKTSDLLLFAKWTPINYTITYEGLEGAENPNPATYTIEDKWALRSLSRTGYSFKGWKKGNKKITNISETGGGNITLTAEWELASYGISYNLTTPNGVEHIWGGGSFTIEQDVVLEGNPAQEPYFIEYDRLLYGYNFLGWYENSSYTGSPISGWTKGQKTSSVILYGKFEAKTCSISFDSCGGNNNIENQTATFNTSYVIKPEDPVYNDYTFMGWYYDIEKTKPFDFSKKFMDTENITLYGKWGMFVYVEGATVEKNLPISTNKESWFTGGGTITIPSLYVSDHETTQAEYTKYCKYSGKKPSEDSYKPVSYVSWYDAIIYCNLRSIAEGLTPVYIYEPDYYTPATWTRNPLEWPFIIGDDESKYCGTNDGLRTNIVADITANGYRLPTEVEWEYIAREGCSLSTYKYSGSNNLSEVGCDSIYYGKCKKPNSLGVYDMSGNIKELCWASHKGSGSSCFTENNYAAIHSGVEIGGTLDAFYREWEKPYEISESVGFRVVRNASE